MNVRACLLLLLQALFLGRVVGQVLVVLVAPDWLPAARYWYSGLLPYPVLLPAQILLLMLMSMVTYDAFRAQGVFHPERPTTLRRLRICAYAYMAIMAARYVATMIWMPELRWFGHAIPITFHFVLATYLLVLGTTVHGSDVRDAYRPVRLS